MDRLGLDLVGAIEGYEYADFVVSIPETGYFGMMRVGPIVYEIRQGSDGSTYIREPDIAAYELKSACAHGINAHEGEKAADALSNSGPDPKHRPAATNSTRTSSGTAVIDILLMYTAGAASNYDTEALANSSIAWLNISLDDSDIDAVGRIVHYAASDVQVSNVTNSEAIGIANRMRNGSPTPYADIPDLRNDHYADIALLIWDAVNASETCGAGLPPSSPSGSLNAWTANTGDSCIGMFNNFSHEIGHILGNGHEYPWDPLLGAYSFGNGYTYSGGGGVSEFRTIMGSQGTCDLSGCDRLNLWSDPDKNFQGVPIGVVNQNDSVRSMETMVSVIAGYRTPNITQPGSMNTVSVVPGYCFGNNWVNYSAPSGLIGWYEIETDSSSSFSSPSTFYRGVKESVPLNVSSTTWVRARACNSAGCNSWNIGTQTATYTAGCL